MGFLDRIKMAQDLSKGRSTDLPLEMLLSPRIQSTNGAKIIVYVLDPTVFRGEELSKVFELWFTSNERDLPILEKNLDDSVHRFKLDHSNDSFLSEAVKRLDTSFFETWFRAGILVAEIETELGIRVIPNRVNSVTSSVLALKTIKIEEPEDAIIAQTFLRLGYAIQRLKIGGPSAASAATNQILVDYRLFLTPGYHEEALAWCARLPNEALRRVYSTKILDSFSDERKFVLAVREASTAVLAFIMSIAQSQKKQ